MTTHIQPEDTFEVDLMRRLRQLPLSLFFAKQEDNRYVWTWLEAAGTADTFGEALEDALTYIMTAFVSSGELTPLSSEEPKQERQMLRLAIPLPCGTTDCTNEALVASAESVPVLAPGHWLIFPRCRECTKHMAELYNGKEREEG